MPHAASPLRHTTGLAITAGVHVLLGAALLSLGVVKLGPTPPVAPIKTVNIPDPVAPAQPVEPVFVESPVAPSVDVPMIVVDIPAPARSIWTAPDLPPSPANSGAGTAPVVTDPQLPPEPVFVDARLDRRFADRFQPPYPASAQRLEQEGVVILRVLVGSDGRVTRAEIRSSSGHASLDESAIRHALRAWRFVPATRDGAAVEAWRDIPVRFELQNG